MSWRLTAVLAALLAVALAVYLFGPSGAGAPPEDPRLLAHLAPDTVVRVEIARRGEPAFVLERGRDVAGEHWRAGSMVVDDPAMREIVASFERFTTRGALDAAAPEAAPAITGLEAPRLVVTFQSVGGRDTLRFGRTPPTNSNAIFFQKDGDRRVFLADLAAYAALDKSPGQLRERRLLRYAPHTIVRVVLRAQFKVARGRDPKDIATEIEESVIERVAEGAERGWSLVKPHREKLDDLRVQRLVSELASMPVAGYQEAGDAKAKGLEPPQVEVLLTPAGTDVPLVVKFGTSTDDNRRRIALVPGMPDWAQIEERRFTDLPTQRKDLRSDIIFPFTKEQVKTFAIQAPGAGALLIERRESKRENDPLPAVAWELVRPAGIRINKEKIEPFVGSFLYQRVVDFPGVIEDLKPLRLDPADATVEVELKDGRKMEFRFGATANAAYLKRDAIAEIFRVQPDLVRLLRRVELSLLHEEMYNVPITALREITFEAKVRNSLEPVFYTLRKTSDKGWAFADPKNADKKPNAQWVNDIAVMMNFIRADEGTFAGRDQETVAKLGLGDGQAPARLRILADAEPREFELLISDNQSEKAGRWLYYAREKGSTVVFKIGGTLIEALKDVRLAKD
ncbi:MAG TPA: DUF4340 domain-containing protein [Planctomycetota bacterium]